MQLLQIILNTTLQDMKWLIEFTKNWKHRNLLHIVGGILIAFLPNLILNNLIGLIVGIWLCAVIGYLWEREQVKSFSAKFSLNDILLTMLGGLIIGIIL